MDAHCGTTLLNTSSDHRLPSDVCDHILSILEAQGQSASLAKVAQCSSSMCQRVISYLYRSFTLDDKSVNWVLKSIFQNQPSGQGRHQHVCSSIRTMVIQPVTQPISNEVTHILKTTKPSGTRLHVALGCTAHLDMTPVVFGLTTLTISPLSCMLRSIRLENSLVCI
ncbi:hypothetical protein I203_100965 [Kwoniella mangroviensis CBS 8507]|uniref:uncharacterized protein n=1 Tax=Kwoniella mangroviensis CBS 8507 TaxID=1296122 RepID=UPI00303228AF